MPSIVDFAEDPLLIGRPGRRLYPRQKTLLRLVYLEEESMTAYDRGVIDSWRRGFVEPGDRMGVSPDVWERVGWLRERGYRHFREVAFIGGRRGGKGLLGAIITAYEIFRLTRLGDPQAFYNIDPSKPIMVLVTATNHYQARSNQFDDIVRLITEGHCLRNRVLHVGADSLVVATPADERRGADLGAHDLEGRWQLGSLRVQALSSNARAARGVASLLQIYDELAHMQVGTPGPQTAEELYRALVPSLDQFHKDGFIYVPTSPYAKQGPAYETYQDGLATDLVTGVASHPEILVIQLPSWGPYEDFDDSAATEGRVFAQLHR